MSAGAELAAVDKFAANVKSFIEYLRDLFQDCKESGHQIVPDILLEMGIQVVEGYSTRDLIESLIETSYEHWRHIHERNDLYFNQNLDSVFAGLKMQNVKLFEKLLTTRDSKDQLVVSDQDRENIWDYLNSFVKLALQFIHETRQPVILITVDSNGQPITVDGKLTQKPCYIRQYMENINLADCFKMFNSKDANFKRRFSDKMYVTTDGTPYSK